MTYPWEGSLLSDMCLLEPESCVLPVVKRFLTFPLTTQHAILHQLRWTVFPEGFFSQVPASEWLRLLCLTDPLIYCAGGRRVPTYQVVEGRQVLLLLASHYLDVY